MRWMVLFAAGFLLCVGGYAKPKKESAVEKLWREFWKHTQNKSWVKATAALRRIGKEGGWEAVKALITAAIRFKERDDIVGAVLQTLQNMEGKRNIDAICRAAVKWRGWEGRVVALQALIERYLPEVNKTYLECLKDKNERVVILALRGIAFNGALEAVPELLKMLKELEKEKGLVWLEVKRTLATLLGEECESVEGWEAAWREKKEQLERAKRQGDYRPREDVGWTVVAKEKEKAGKFFGTEVLSNRVIFLIDCSSSMQARDPAMVKNPDGQLIQKTKLPKNAATDAWGGYPCLPESRARIERVKRELIKCIKGLRKSVKFNVMAFATGVKRWKRRLVYATAANKQAAIAWVRSLRADGDTCTDEALKAAFADPEVDTIYLLSDGQPWKGEEPIDVDTILQWVKANNRFRGITIHTFGFEQAKKTPHMDTGAMMKLLKGLAQMTGGKFTNIYW